MMFVTLMRLAAFLLALSQSSICGSRGQCWADLFCVGFFLVTHEGLSLSCVHRVNVWFGSNCLSGFNFIIEFLV